MIFPQSIYQLNRAQDYVSQRLEAIQRSAVIAINVGTNSATTKVMTVPNDKVLVVGQLWAATAATAEVSVWLVNASLSYVDVGEANALGRVAAVVTGFNVPGLAGRTSFVGGVVDVVIPGGHDVYVGANLGITLVAAAQACYVGLSGILIPRGNVQQA